jgi:hypothetical protein
MKPSHRTALAAGGMLALAFALAAFGCDRGTPEPPRAKVQAPTPAQVPTQGDPELKTLQERLKAARNAKAPRAEGTAKDLDPEQERLVKQAEELMASQPR